MEKADESAATVGNFKNSSKNKRGADVGKKKEKMENKENKVG